RNLARAMKPGGRLMVMHLAGSEAINAFHAGVEGAVSVDHLPVGDQWLPLLEAAGLRLVSLIDTDDLFLLTAE
ncbi:MAG: SAM-dependent methyltransferase, partial [Patescibacteria group bacterium]|nr:SAM-dependent methyltransferase [Patescibacteria group bacterium]